MCSTATKLQGTMPDISECASGLYLHNCIRPEVGVQLPCRRAGPVWTAKQDAMARGRAAGVIPYTLESRLVVAGLQMG